MVRIFQNIFFILFISGAVLAQQQAPDQFHAHHSLGLVISHTNIRKGINTNGGNKWLTLPSWGLNYNYKFSPKWAIGLHNDIVTEAFEVEEHLKGGDATILARSYPVATALVASFKPGKNFTYLLGSGEEFAHTGNLFLIRIGVEYGYHLNNDWELNAVFVNDLKVNAYNSFAVGLGITKVF